MMPLYALAVRRILASGRIGYRFMVWICGILQMLSNLMFAVQAMVGHDTVVLAVTIGLENFAGGMGTAAFVASDGKLAQSLADRIERFVAERSGAVVLVSDREHA